MPLSLKTILLAFVTLVVLATYAVAQAAVCPIPQCAECLLGSTTQCGVCNPGYRRNANWRCVTVVNGAVSPQSAVAAVTALVAAMMVYVL